jgi:hypothetical protein
MNIQRKSGKSPMDVGRKFDECGTEVGRTSEKSPTNVERAELSRCYCDGGRRCYTIAPCNAMLRRWRCCGAGQQHAVARNVAVTLASDTLQLTALLRPRGATFLFFFLLDNFKKEKEWEKERNFETCFLVSRLRWL